MLRIVSKSQLKPHTLKYLREVEKTRASIVITRYGKPVAKIVPHSGSEIDESLLLRDSVISYNAPLSPVGNDDWEVEK